MTTADTTEVSQANHYDWDTIKQYLPLFINYHETSLNRVNPGTFRFMSQQQKNAQTMQLRRTLCMLSFQRTITENESLKNAIWVCNYYIFLLNNKSADELAAAAPVKYLGLPIGRELGRQVDALTDNVLDPTQDILSQLHQARSYWRSAGGLANSVLSVLPQDSFHTNQAQGLFQYEQQPYGYLSWIIAYTRFALNLFLLVKNTSPWMRKKNNDDTFSARFKNEWKQRKFILLDTFLSGTVNLLCFFWITGSASLQYTASFVNMAALCCDLGLTLWMIHQQKALHNKKIQDLEKRITELKDLNKNPIQIEELEAIKKKLEKEWEYTSTKLNYGLMLTIGMTLGALVIFGLLCPPAILPAAVTLALTITGLAIGLACTLVYQYKSDQLERKKTKEIIKEKVELIEDKLTQWKDLEKNDKSPEKSDQQKLLYLEIQALKAENIEQQRVMEHQRNRHLLSLVTKTLVPIIITTSLVFAPLGIGLPILAVAICGLLLAQFILNRKKLKAEETPQFDETKYNEFRAITLAGEKSEPIADQNNRPDDDLNDQEIISNLSNS